MPKKLGGPWLLIGLFAGVLCLGAFFWWIARSSNESNFLNAESPAAWIVYPQVPTGRTRSAIELPTTFRRSFSLDKNPETAKLSIRGMKRWTLAINGVDMTPVLAADHRWKDITVVDTAHQLRPGTNEIVLKVFNNNGPAALWLTLDVDGRLFNSDTNWLARILDSAECNASDAASRVAIAPGNRLLVAETPLAGFRHHPVFFICAVAASLALVLALWNLQRSRAAFVAGPEFALCALAITSLLWVVLYYHNLPVLPNMEGFDAPDHLTYINYIQSRSHLPLANEGWQMYQPPLYYLLSATSVEITQPTTLVGEVMIIRILGLAIALTHFTLILLSLRLIFPRRPGAQVFGLSLAALLPAQLYIAEYVTNESLAAMLVTCSLYLCLRIVIEKRDSWRIHLALGIFFGAALLAKVTAVLAAPVIAIALIDPLIFSERERFRMWAGNVFIAAMACVAVCGWHYHRVWSHFGSPLLGNWDPSAGPAWWMEPGFRTWSYFFRFGRCLTNPWYAGLDGFADGLYSTLWGDGLLGGKTAVEYRPPWNYNLMAAGFLLALVPSIFIVTGTTGAVRNFFRQPSRIWLLLLGVPFVTLSALIYMNLKVPAYGEAKSFYGLIALLPICALASLGYESIKRCGKLTLLIATTIFGVWAMNSYASFWIRRNAPETQFQLALDAMAESRKEESLQHYAAAVRGAPRDIKIKALMVRELALQSETAQIKAIATEALKDPVEGGDGHCFLAEILAADGQWDAAIAEARHSIDLAPDNPNAHNGLCEWLGRSGRFAEAISAGSQAERINPFNPNLQFNIGYAFSSLHDETNALVHLRLAASLEPTWAEAHDRLGLCLIALQQYNDATNQFLQAVQLKPDNTAFHFHLASAFACQGDTEREIEQYRQILKAVPKSVLALNALAWRLATGTNSTLGDGTEAIPLALRACELTESKEAQFLETLAAAYARAGLFDEATATAEQATKLAERTSETERVESIRNLRELFRSGTPYTDKTTQPLVSLDIDFGKRHTTN